MERERGGGFGCHPTRLSPERGTLALRIGWGLEVVILPKITGEALRDSDVGLRRLLGEVPDTS